MFPRHDLGVDVGARFSTWHVGTSGEERNGLRGATTTTRAFICIYIHLNTTSGCPIRVSENDP